MKTHLGKAQINLVGVFLQVLVVVALGCASSQALALNWSQNVLVSAAVDTPVSMVKTAVASNGKVMVVWVQSDGVAQSIYAKQQGIADGLPGIPLESSSMPADNPQVAAYGQGNFMAVWHQAWKTVNGALYGIYSSRYDGQNWGPVELVYVDTSRTDVTANGDVQLAVDSNGNAVAVWSVYDWSWNHTSVRASRYVVGTGWTGSVNLSTESVQQASSPNVAIDTNGNALVVWSQSAGTTNSVAGVHAATYSMGSGWGATTLIGTSHGLWDGQSPQVAFDSNGNALAVWTDYPKPGIRSNRYMAGTGWGTEVSVADPGITSYDEGVKLAFDKTGNAMAVWNQYGGVLYANRYVPGAGWGTTVVVESNGTDYAEKITFDQSGNAIALWANYSCNSYNIQSSRYSALSGWETVNRCYQGAFSVNTTLDNAGDPQLVIDAAGKATAVWVQSGRMYASTTDAAGTPTTTTTTTTTTSTSTSTSTSTTITSTTTTTLQAPKKTYVDNGDGTVTDPVTGLVWMRCVMGQTWSGNACVDPANNYTWAQANALVGTVQFANQNDWRLPNIRELQTIVDQSVAYPAIDGAVFDRSSASASFWSASPYAIGTGSAWEVGFYGGNSGAFDKGSTLHVRMVRAGQSWGLLDVARPNTDYVEQGDGTVTHVPSGLTWQRCAMGQTWSGSSCTGSASTFTWDQSIALSSNIAGKTDWRLPTHDELSSLVDYVKVNPALNSEVFPNTSTARFWSASAFADDASAAWYVDFASGDVISFAKSNTYQVRLVRSSQSSGTVPLMVIKTGIGAVNSVGQPGIACGAVCASGFNPGEVITLNASPLANLVSWGGACSGNVATCTVTMDTAKNVTASFITALPVPTTTTTSTSTSTTMSTTTTTTLGGMLSLTFVTGWNLAGNGSTATIDVAVFNDVSKTTTVWKWLADTSKWAFYTPSLAGQQLLDYISSKGYALLTSIGAGEGFWVNAKVDFSTQVAAPAAVTSVSFQPQLDGTSRLLQGWNMIAIGDNKTPSEFNKLLSTTPPAVGAIPINVTTLWAWDSGLTNWYFYAPSLDSNGGLGSYISGKGYLDFAATGKVLTPGTGFWVNKP